MRWHCRDAGAGDYPAIREIAQETFPAATLLPPAQFVTLLSRTPPLARIVERADGGGGTAACGYYALWPMSQPTCEALAAGRLRERDLDDARLLDLSGAQTEVLYVMDVCIRRGLGPGPVLRLMLDLRNVLRQTLTASPRLALVAAWAYTPVGARICGEAGMEPRGSGAGEPGIWTGQRGAVLAALGRGGAAARSQRRQARC